MRTSSNSIDFMYRNEQQARFTLYNVCSVHRGMFSTSGDIMSTLGDIMSTSGDVQYIGDIMMHVGEYHDACGGYHEYIEGCSVHRGIP